MTTTMTIRMETAVKNRLNKAAKATNRSESFLAAEAIRQYIEMNEWQVQSAHFRKRCKNLHLDSPLPQVCNHRWLLA